MAEYATVLVGGCLPKPSRVISSIRVIVYNYDMRQQIILAAGDPIGHLIMQQYFAPSRRVCRKLEFGLD